MKEFNNRYSVVRNNVINFLLLRKLRGGGVELMVTNLFADAAPGIVENCMLITRHRGVQLL